MVTLWPIRNEYSLWPLNPWLNQTILQQLERYLSSFSELVDSPFIDDFVLKFFKDLNDNGMVGDSISAEVPTRYWQYPASWTTNHSGVTSDMLYFRCFVVQSSNSTLYNINTVVTAYKLIWPYLIKMESWFYPSHCPIPSRLTCSESLQPWWLQSTETF